MMPDISLGVKILELINKPQIYWGLGITSSLMLFLPDKVLTQLGLLIIIDEYRPYIGMGLIISLALIIISGVRYLYLAWDRYTHKPEYLIKQFFKKEVTLDEIRFLVNNYYDVKEDRFKLSKELSLMEGIKKNLQLKGVLYQSSNLMDCSLVVPFNLNPKAISILEKAKLRGDIRIEVHDKEIIDVWSKTPLL